MTKVTSLFLLFFLLPVYGQDPDTIQRIDDTATISKVKFEDHFKDKYKSQEFIYEQLAPQESLWQRFLTWLSQFFSRQFDFETADSAMNLVSTLLNSLLILVLLVVVYFIARALLQKEGKWIFGKNTSRSIISYDGVERNIHLVDFEKLIRQNIQSGETRLSIRYYYLWLLKRMADRQLIEWDPEKTNSDYLYEIKSDQLRAEFSYLSYLYNYIWYGEFEIEAASFEKAKRAFEKTIQSI